MIASNIWEEILSRVQAKVNRHSFYTWFKPTAFVADDGFDRDRACAERALQRLDYQALFRRHRRSARRSAPNGSAGEFRRERNARSRSAVQPRRAHRRSRAANRTDRNQNERYEEPLPPVHADVVGRA